MIDFSRKYALLVLASDYPGEQQKPGVYLDLKKTIDSQMPIRK
jgi:hypothetical protein